MTVRVLVIGLSPTLGGVETYIYNLIKYMDKEKYKFDFMIIGDEKKAVYHDEINNLINDGNKHFYYCKSVSQHYFESKIWLKQFYKTHIYDCIYLNTVNAVNILYCKYGIGENKGKLITHSHTSNGSFREQLFNSLFRPLLNNKSSIRLACSDVAAKWLYGNKSDLAQIIPNGIDVNRFSFSSEARKRIRAEYNLNEDDIIVGHVGRFSMEKNHEYFIEVALKTSNRYHFLFVGEGELKKSFIDRISNNKLSDRFTILDVKQNIEDYYSAMDIFFMPSIYEGMPLVAIEAQCNGLPCVLSDSISRQVDITGHCFFFKVGSDDDGINRLNSIGIERYDGGKLIEEKGFSIKETAEIISRYIDGSIL